MVGAGKSGPASAHHQGAAPRILRPEALTRAMLALEAARPLDVAARAVGVAANRVVRSPRVDDVLRGTWLGHAVHPLLTDLPIGSWTSASLLDLVGGRRSRPAATLLVGFGLAAAVPTAMSGLAEHRGIERRSQRVAAVHGLANTAAAALYATSLLARLRGRHGKGVGLAAAGFATTMASGYLGSHLSLVRKVATADPAYDEPHGAQLTAAPPRADVTPLT